QNPEEFQTECYKFDKEISNINSAGETDYAGDTCSGEIFLSSASELKEDSVDELKCENVGGSYKDGNFGSKADTDLDTIDRVNELFCNLRGVNG
ncbi:21556_t:CDS:1, partial [Dentiscutata erythropus]